MLSFFFVAELTYVNHHTYAYFVVVLFLTGQEVRMNMR